MEAGPEDASFHAPLRPGAQPDGAVDSQHPTMSDLGGMFSGMDLAGDGPADLGSNLGGGSTELQPTASGGGNIFAGMDTGFQDLGFTAVTPESQTVAPSPGAAPLGTPYREDSVPHGSNGTSAPLSPAGSDAAAKSRSLTSTSGEHPLGASGT